MGKIVSMKAIPFLLVVIAVSLLCACSESTPAADKKPDAKSAKKDKGAKVEEKKGWDKILEGAKEMANDGMKQAEKKASEAAEVAKKKIDEGADAAKKSIDDAKKDLNGREIKREGGEVLKEGEAKAQEVEEKERTVFENIKGGDRVDPGK